MSERFTKTQCRYCDGSGYHLDMNGAWLREQREQRGLTLRELARRVKLTPAYISDIERGRRIAPPRTETKLTAVLLNARRPRGARQEP